MASSNNNLYTAISNELSQTLGRTVQITPTSGGGASGGGGVQALAASQTMRVPTPLCFGQDGTRSFVIFEYLQFCSGGSGRETGVQLAKMHRTLSTNGLFGFDVDNTIGATPQPNLPWKDDWADFWDTHRLGHMLELTDNAGYGDDEIEKLRIKTKQLLSHKPQPSLLHGDLWGGNKGYVREADGTVVPVIFDPAVYYGDREADIAMTYLFGGFGSDFYQGYESEWPLPEGHANRRTVYNLYHILNHEVLFGGYLGQARSMIQQILRY
ncbi:Fructosamine kinase [Fragilaria crotonensis]|nr:Fructosamine kinase [Fragilaria crotonensis]